MYTKTLLSAVFALLTGYAYAGWNGGSASGGPGATAHLPLSVAGCVGTTGSIVWDTVAATAPTATCSVGTVNNTLMRGTVDFVDTGGAHMIQQALTLPSDFKASAGMSLVLFWRSPTATAVAAVWTAQVVCVADGSVDDVAWGTAVNVTDTTKGVAHQLNQATITLTGAPMSSCTAGPAILHIRISRDGANASDTLGDTASLAMVELVYGRQ